MIRLHPNQINTYNSKFIDSLESTDTYTNTHKNQTGLNWMQSKAKKNVYWNKKLIKQYLYMLIVLKHFPLTNYLELWWNVVQGHKICNGRFAIGNVVVIMAKFVWTLPVS